MSWSLLARGRGRQDGPEEARVTRGVPARAPTSPPERGVVRDRRGEVFHLRRATEGDAQALLTAYAADPAATRFLSWPPRRSTDEVRAWLRPSLAGWDARTTFRWVLAPTPEGDAVGTVVLRAQHDGWSLGYALAQRVEGRGIASAAVRRLCAWAPTCLGPATPLLARCDPEHAASIAVLRRTGFALVRRERAAWVRPSLGPTPRDTLLWQRPALRAAPVVCR